MTEIAETNVNDLVINNSSRNDDKKPTFELYVKASGLDSSRIGACIFCQEFWIELYALKEIGVVNLDVKVVNVNSEKFKQRFLGEQPPILVDMKKGITYSDNSDIEKKIFHLANDSHVPLFDKDAKVAKHVDTLYRNFKIFLRAKIDHDKMGSRGNKAKIEGFPPQLQASYDKLIDQLSSIDEILGERKSLYLLGNSMTEYDASLLPRIHHIRIIGHYLLNFVIPHNLVYLWHYLQTGYRTAAFMESSPSDQDILFHYREQLKMSTSQREIIESPTYTFTIPQSIQREIEHLGIDANLVD